MSYGFLNRPEGRDNLSFRSFLWDSLSTSVDVWVPFNIESRFSFLYLLVIGGGGGGGNGATGSTGVARGGGGGGGPGAAVKLLTPLLYLPKTLYLRVSPSVPAATAGGISYVSISPSVTANENLIIANGGSNGASPTTGSGAAGAAGAASLAGWLNGMTSFPTALIGTAGGSGSGAVGASANYGISGALTMGGMGGGGCTTTDFAGGSITSASSFNIYTPTIPGGATAGLAGGSGLDLLPFDGTYPMLTGGAGGASNNAATGGAGGDGGYGCGGGGGGGGTTGGAGGRGGSGAILAILW